MTKSMTSATCEVEATEVLFSEDVVVTHLAPNIHYGFAEIQSLGLLVSDWAHNLLSHTVREY